MLASLSIMPDTGSYLQRKCKDKLARGRLQLSYLKAIAFETPEVWANVAEMVDLITTRQDSEVSATSEAAHRTSSRLRSRHPFRSGQARHFKP